MLNDKIKEYLKVTFVTILIILLFILGIFGVRNIFNIRDPFTEVSKTSETSIVYDYAVISLPDGPERNVQVESFYISTDGMITITAPDGSVYYTDKNNCLFVKIGEPVSN